MIERFATKRDINGNRYFLGIDHEKRVFSRESAHWYSRADLVAELTRKQRRAIIEQLEDAGYAEINYI